MDRNVPSSGEIVTFLLTDIEGSTRLWEAHTHGMQLALARHDALAVAVVAQHAGVLVRSRGEGDSLFAVFDHAPDLQQALRREPWPTPVPLHVRMALHTGDAGRRDGDYYGPTVNRCARLRAVAHGGQVLVSMATEAQVREKQSFAAAWTVGGAMAMDQAVDYALAGFGTADATA